MIQFCLRLGLYILSFLSEKHLHFTWYINSLFSSPALNRLATRSGCQKKKNIKCLRNAKYRTIDGTCNNLHYPLFGSAPMALNRLVPAKYYDHEGLNDPIGFPGQANVPDIPKTFEVVKKFIIEQDDSSQYPLAHSHLFMQFGQFLDHDFSLSPESQSSDNCQNVK